MASEKQDSECNHCRARLKSAFCVLSQEEFENLSLVKQCTLYKKGRTIFSEGTLPEGLYCVHNGKVKITQTGADGKEQILHLAKSGDVIGYRAILGGDRFSCSAVTLEDSEVCFIPKNIFLSLIESNSKLAMQFINMFATLLRDMERNLVNLSQSPVKERIAQCLILLKRNYGFVEGTNQLNIAITREEMANIASTTRETLIRTLVEFQDEHIIELTGKRIAILDHKKLERLANIPD